MLVEAANFTTSAVHIGKNSSLTCTSSRTHAKELCSEVPLNNQEPLHAFTAVLESTVRFQAHIRKAS